MRPAIHFHTSRTGPCAKAWSSPLGEPTLLISADRDGSRLYDLNSRRPIESWADPLSALAWVASSRISGRWVGFLSYDLGYLFESIGSGARDDLQLPLFAFAFFPQSSFRSASGENEENAKARRREEMPRSEFSSEEFFRVLPSRLRLLPGYQAREKYSETNFTKDDYERTVVKAKNFIAAGDVFQINLAQRFSIATRLTAEEIHARLLRDSPAAYGALLDFADFALVSNSPELFLKVDSQPDGTRRISTRPIKGTRPRLPGMEQQLRDSVKDQAELNMIIDLERNDLGRVCEIGSVRVSQPRTIESHPTIYHGVATIEGTLRREINFLDILKATFPGGSVTGAPKIRAMQLIDQLEPVRRGPYCGAIGYLDSDGSMQFNLAIRTIILKDGIAHVSVGGGIVADSEPAAEYAETLVKAQAMFRALDMDATKINFHRGAAESAEKKTN